MQHERGHPDGREHVAHVDLEVHHVELAEGPRACALSHAEREVLDLLVHPFAVEVRARQLDRAPEALVLRVVALRLLARHPVREAGRAREPRQRPVDDERPAALGVGGREEDAHRPALGGADHGRGRGAGRVHDRAHVVHAGLEVGDAGHAVGQSGAALVEQDQAGEGSEPAEERRLPLVRPDELDVRDRAGNPDQVEGPVAQHLVGDRDLAALRVARLRPVHVDSFRFRACMGKWRDG